MTQAVKMVSRQKGISLIPAAVTLAFWRLRQTWRLLFATGAGIIVAVVLVCAIPLYTQIAMTAGLRSMLAAFPENTSVFTHSTAEQISPAEVAEASQLLDQTYQNDLGSYLSTASTFSIQTQGLTLLTRNARGVLSATGHELQMLGFPARQVPAHVSLVQGRLPRAANDAIEVALSPGDASDLHVGLGSELHVALYLTSGIAAPVPVTLTLRVVGIFNPLKADDTFWHGADFQHYPLGAGILYKALVSNDAFMASVSRLAGNLQAKGMTITNPPDLYWYYQLDPARIQASDINALINGLHSLQVDATNHVSKPPFYEKTQVYTPSDTLVRYRDRMSLTQLPVTILSCLVVILILFFVSMMAELLADDQSGALAILRSRGASARQIFGSFVVQSICLGIAALIIGPLLAIWVVSLLEQRLLPPVDQGALAIITHHPLQTIGGLSGLTLVTVVVAVVTMVFAINDTTSRDVLALRREAARSTRQPFWQRLYLDVVGIVMGATGYGFALYAQNANVLDAQASVLVLTPLNLLSAIFLLFAFTLLFLRLFPLILRLGERLSSRSHGATALLALAQMARAPRRSVRMALLLALSASFVIFTLVFTASQVQRITDVAAYQVGADFSGYLSNSSNGTLAQQTAQFRAIRGVTAVSMGYASQGTANENILDVPIQIRAVDVATFSRTALWTTQDSTQPLSTLLQELLSRRNTVAKTNTVPAIIDASTANLLHLARGDQFTLNDNNNDVSFVVVDRVQHIPTISDTPNASDTSTNIALGGVLIDFQSYATVQKTLFHTQLAPNFVWLRSHDDNASLAHVRAALNNGSLQLLAPYDDRRAITTVLQNDPLSLALLGVLALGALLPILLALGGSFISSWLNARRRLVNFAVLRALGTAPRQIVGVLLWEQGIVYLIALALGILFGAVLSTIALPSLIFTGIASGNGSDTNNNATTEELYRLQNVPPVHLVLPNTLFVALAAFVVICIVALVLMVRIVSRESAGRTLRLNED